ncbi:MAG: hypothetical protein BGO29_03605 [Bacteroidales bacterium 36-12]|nr:MAG: hypothetical protein BGO29_03605 [Bacteroidales bacterium 36-12]
MKLQTTIFLLLFVLISNIYSQSSELHIMTYNLRFGERASMEEFAAYINQQKPDLVALQECDWKTYRSFTSKQAGKAFVNELAYHTGMFGLFGKAINYKGGLYGIGILSNFPIIKSERVLLPNPNPKTEQRALLLAEIELPDKSRVMFVSTHLEYSSEQVREKQIAFINKFIKKIKIPVILAGDLNAEPTSKEIEKGLKNWFNATDTNYTFSTDKPDIKLDYILGYPKKKFELISTKVDYSIKISDHFPVSSVIKIK